jgi:hypothetical protein
MISGPPAMTEAEYSEAIRALHRRPDLAKSPDLLSEAEFLLTIEYRLGRDFSPERCSLLLEAHRAMRAEMNRLTRKFLWSPFAPNRHARKVNALQKRLMDVFASLLTGDEFRAFIGIGPEAGFPQLIDAAKIPPH